MSDHFAKTPRYVLKDGASATGPSVLQPESQSEITAVFGFSDKPQYDEFLSQSALALTPYPLVKGFLKNQIDLDSDVLRLVVLDATGPEQSILCAATMQAIVAAFDSKLDSVEVSHELVLDTTSGFYRVESHAVTSGRKPNN